jgi:hypothetical protein
MDDIAFKVLERIGTGAVVDQFAIMLHFKQVQRAFKIKGEPIRLLDTIESLLGPGLFDDPDQRQNMCNFTPGRHFDTLPLDVYTIMGSNNLATMATKLKIKLRKSTREEHRAVSLRAFEEDKKFLFINQQAGGRDAGYHEPAPRE